MYKSREINNVALGRLLIYYSIVLKFPNIFDRLETSSVKKAGYAKAMAMAPFFYVSKLITYFTFLTYILMGYKLTAEVVFVTLSLYTPVRMMVTYYLPIGAQYLSEALVTVDRMQVLYVHVHAHVVLHFQYNAIQYNVLPV